VETSTKLFLFSLNYFSTAIDLVSNSGEIWSHKVRKRCSKLL